jgi:translation initiation factor 3 subunit L
MDGIELNKRTLMNRVTACHVTAFYYVGFCYLMLRRYADAHRSFSHILVHMSRSKNYQTKSYQFDQINKKVDQMYALLSIVVALYPTRIDDSISFNLKEKHSEHIAKMRSGSEGLAVFEELFLYSCPKFIFAKPTPAASSDDGSSTHVEPYQRHLQVFLEDVKVQSLLPTLRSYLGLYTSLSVSKLATFVEIQPEELLAQLIVLKQRSLQKRWTSGNLLSGELHLTNDIDFVIQGDIITISEIKMSRRTGDFFLRQTSKFQDLIDHLNKTKQ